MGRTNDGKQRKKGNGLAGNSRIFGMNETLTSVPDAMIINSKEFFFPLNKPFCSVTSL